MIAQLSRNRLAGRPRLALIVAYLAGAALVPAFEPIGLYPLALFSPALLFHLWLCAPRARDAAWIGFAYGMGLFTAGVSWVYVSLSVFGGMPMPVAAFATLAYCAFLSWPLAAAGYAQHRIPASDAVRALCVFPALWMAAELLRGWGLTGFPWLVLGYAATDTPVAGYAPVTGVYGLSLIAAVCAGLVLRAATVQSRGLPLVLLGVVLAVGAALRTVDWTQPYGPPVPASLLQGNVAQETKFDPERFERTFTAYERLASASRAKLIVLPETALPRFLDRIDPAQLAALEAIAKRNGGDLLLGVPYRTGQERYFNSVVSLGVSPPQIYSKSHLVPFGEFILPGFGWIVNVLQIPMSEFTRGGTAQPPLAVAGQKVAVNICYEDAFGEELIGTLPEATLLVNVSNMAWFGDTLAPGQHLQMARMRSLETGRALLAATNTGMTAAIDRDGRVLARLPQYQEGRLDVEVSGYSGATPFVRYGNGLALAAAAALLALSAALRKR